MFTGSFLRWPQPCAKAQDAATELVEVHNTDSRTHQIVQADMTSEIKAPTLRDARVGMPKKFRVGHLERPWGSVV